MKRKGLHPGSIGYRRDACATGFTLIELLVVIGIIAVIGSITVIAFRAVARDSRLASGKNVVMSSLDTARAFAMKNNVPVLVAFYPRLEREKVSRIDVVIAAWTGATKLESVNFGGATGTIVRVFDEFAPIPNVRLRSLPEGIGIGGPFYAADEDDQWLVPSNLAKTGEEPGQCIGVMFAPDGTTRVDNPVNDSDFYWVDLNGDGIQQRDSASIFVDTWFFMVNADDEPAVELVKFLTVFDEDEARSLMGDDDWNAGGNRQIELSDYINKNADRIHFNRYTGVAMR